MQNDYLTLADCDVSGKRVLVRCDFNVPVTDGCVVNEERIDRALPTIRQLQSSGAQIILMSHFGRPKPGVFDPVFSLQPVQKLLEKKLGISIPLVKEPLMSELPAVEVVLLENTRFWEGEIENDPALSAKLAELADVFVMDAFATAHRAHASTVGIVNAVTTACAGPLLCEELTALTRALGKPERPIAAIVGGAKVSTKIKLIDALLERVDYLLVGGGIANTFLLAKGYPVGQSLVEVDCVSYAKAALEKAAQKGVTIPLPTDVLVASDINSTIPRACGVDAVHADEAIFDVGPVSRLTYAALFQAMQTILWNGPVGVFEKPAFAAGTQAMAEAIAASNAFSIAGGGDTLAAIAQFGLRDNMSYLSTGGGAFLAFCEGAVLPTVQALMDSKRRSVHG